MTRTAYSNFLHQTFPTLNEKTPWLDINNNGKKEKNEIVTDIHQSSEVEYGKEIIKEDDKKSFLYRNLSNLDQSIKTKLILESIKYIDYNLSSEDVSEATTILEKIGEPVLPVAIKYIDSKDPKRRKAIYSLLLGITVQHNKFENLNFIKNVLLPKLKEQQKVEDKWPNTITGLIKKYESIIENNGIVPN